MQPVEKVCLQNHRRLADGVVPIYIKLMDYDLDQVRVMDLRTVMWWRTDQRNHTSHQSNRISVKQVGLQVQEL